jgi:hypothetical protein
MPLPAKKTTTTKTTMKLQFIQTVALTVTAFASLTLAAQAGPDPANRWPKGYPTMVKSKEQAMACCLPREKVALACKDCKTVDAKGGEDKAGIAAWFKPDSMHDCSGCSGKVTYKAQEGKGSGQAIYKHVCSKCGPDSAFTCATHKT